MDDDTLRRVLDNPEATAAVERIEGWRALGDNIIETIINKSDQVKGLKNKGKEQGELTAGEKKELSEAEKEYTAKWKLVQEKLITFATRIPAFMYLTDFRESTLQDVVTKLEPDLFRTVTGPAVEDFHLLVRLKVFNTEQRNQAVFAFRRYKDASLSDTGIESHEGLLRYGPVRHRRCEGVKGQRFARVGQSSVTPSLPHPRLVRGAPGTPIRSGGIAPCYVLTLLSGLVSVPPLSRDGNRGFRLKPL